MWFLLLLGGGYLAYRHFHHSHISGSPIVIHQLTLTPGEINAYGNRLIMLMLDDSPPGQVSISAINFLKDFRHRLDREAIAHSAKIQGADPVAVDRVSLAADKALGATSL